MTPASVRAANALTDRPSELDVSLSFANPAPCHHVQVAPGRQMRADLCRCPALCVRAGVTGQQFKVHPRPTIVVVGFRRQTAASHISCSICSPRFVSVAGGSLISSLARMRYSPMGALSSGRAMSPPRQSHVHDHVLPLRRKHAADRDGQPREQQRYRSENRPVNTALGRDSSVR